MWRAVLLAVLAGQVWGGEVWEGRRGGSLRGALEALQRRQRARAEPQGSLLMYRAHPKDDEEPDLYGAQPTQYDEEPPFAVDENEFEDGIPEKYIIKYLNEEDPSRNVYYEHKKKNKAQSEQKPSAFRERAHTHFSDDDRLEELFAEKEENINKHKTAAKIDNDAEYAMLLNKLWSKYKSHRSNVVENSPEGIVKLFKERKIQKRQYPDDSDDGWGPVAFKKKRSPPENEEEDDDDASDDYPTLEYPLRQDDNYKYTTDDEDSNGKDSSVNQDKDLQDEYIAFQPLDGDKINLPTDGDEYSYDTVVKQFPVMKRSNGFYENVQKKRSVKTDTNLQMKFRSGAGTDPKVMRDLSRIFGEPGEELIKSHVKRSNNEESHEIKPPQITASPHNHTHYNSSHVHDDDSHEHQVHGHPPNVSGKETVETTQHEHNHPISLKKKSIDWSQYFGIDKRKKKSIPYRADAVDKYQNQYLDTFNREMGLLSHNKVKRDFILNKPIDENEFEINRASIAIRSEAKRNPEQQGESKLDSIDRRLAGLESVIVDEALNMPNVDGDSKEQQQLKEKMLSRLAAAYSLEKMRKAIKNFKQTLNNRREYGNPNSAGNIESVKEKRIAIKKDKAEPKHIDMPTSQATADTSLTEAFEGEQAAGQYRNSITGDVFSEGYMGGSGRHRGPVKFDGGNEGNCPVLDRILQRCRGIDVLAGDKGQLFLPLCSLHQVCYLCGESAPTTCDLVFLSEADTACEGDRLCSRAARTSLMAMRELHESLADDLDGECEASPCLAAALQPNLAWTHQSQRIT